MSFAGGSMPNKTPLFKRLSMVSQSMAQPFIVPTSLVLFVQK
jgi:hypothetical protein